jgi:23S rRNA (adenine2503-C2)-methyltransferase
MTLSELESALKLLSQPKFRAKQLFSWFYQKSVIQPDLMPNIPKDLKTQIAQNFQINIPKISDISHCKSDNSYKFLLKTHDDKLIESILMLTDKRATICVSSMIGCPLKCKFCATGTQLKYLRNLDPSEIIGQIIIIQNYAIKNNIAPKITNIVFMGMGEPMLNKENIEKSLDILLHKDGFALSKNRITISTAGVCEGLANLINKYKVKLAISLHFPTDEQRDEFMPINKRYPLKKLISETKKINLGKRDYITIEYLMLNKINDSLIHAKQLLHLLNNLKVKINLIPYNSTKNLPAQSSSEEQINLFAKYLRSKNIMVTVRRSKGRGLEGGCGQFVLKKHN